MPSTRSGSKAAVLVERDEFVRDDIHENPETVLEKPLTVWEKLYNLGGLRKLLILVVMDQRRVEFETGYGLEAVLPDIICYRIINENFVPHFKEGDYDSGLISSVDRVKTLLGQ